MPRESAPSKLVSHNVNERTECEDIAWRPSRARPSAANADADSYFYFGAAIRHFSRNLSEHLVWKMRGENVRFRNDGVQAC